MRAFEFNMALSAHETRAIYQGRARYIQVASDDGSRLRLPAANFREFVTADGIQGRFRVETDQNNRIVHLRRL